MSKTKEKKKDWLNVNVFTYGYLPWTYIPNWPKNIRQIFRNIRYALQRAIKGYCDYDIWSFDQYLTIMIANALKELDDTRHGYPANMTDEVWGETLRSISEHLLNSLEDNEDTKVWKTSNELWNKMQSYEISRDFVERDDGMYGLDIKVSYENEYFKAKEEWLESERDAWEWRESEKDKALDLLKKHFYSLWD